MALPAKNMGNDDVCGSVAVDVAKRGVRVAVESDRVVEAPIAFVDQDEQARRCDDVRFTIAVDVADQNIAPSPEA